MAGESAGATLVVLNDEPWPRPPRHISTLPWAARHALRTKDGLQVCSWPSDRGPQRQVFIDSVETFEVGSDIRLVNAPGRGV